jgi:hypothetical protein
MVNNRIYDKYHSGIIVLNTNTCEKYHNIISVSIKIHRKSDRDIQGNNMREISIRRKIMERTY